MSISIPLIAALHSASSDQLQKLMIEFAAKLTQRGFKIWGVVEIAEAATAGAWGRVNLRDLAGGELIAISHNLGLASEAGNLDGRGLTTACAAVERALAEGLDLVIVSNFDKQEANRSGLHDAFRLAITSRTPLLTTIASAMSELWAAFAGPLSHDLRADAGALVGWGRCVLPGISNLAAE
jgi:nucleoside-triphosphatase THEP1